MAVGPQADPPGFHLRIPSRKRSGSGHCKNAPSVAHRITVKSIKFTNFVLRLYVWFQAEIVDMETQSSLLQRISVIQQDK